MYQALLRFDHIVFHLEKLKDFTCAQELLMTVSNWIEVHDALVDSLELWDTFKGENFKVANGWTGLYSGELRCKMHRGSIYLVI